MDINKIYYKDCRIGMLDLPDKSIDHFYADPPFDIDFNRKESMYNRSKKHVITGYIEPSSETYYDFSKSWISQCHRLLKDNGSGWICSGWTNLVDVLQAIRDCDFQLINHIIWKYHFGVYTKRKFITSHYHLLFVTKNRNKWHFNKDVRYLDTRNSNGNENYQDREDVWVINRPYNHGVSKNANTQPIELVKKALQYTTKEGDIILDCFMGGGTTAIACIELGRHYVGYEINNNLKKLHDIQILKATTQNNFSIEHFDKEKIMSVFQGRIAFAHGKLKQGVELRELWYALSPPYKTVNDIKRQFSRPPNTMIVNGVASAYEVIQLLGYSPSVLMNSDWGMFGLTLRTPILPKLNKKEFNNNVTAVGITK